VTTQQLSTPETLVSARPDPARSIRAAFVCSGIAVLTALLAWRTASGNAQFALSSPFDVHQLPAITVPARVTGWVCTLLVAGVAGLLWAWSGVPRRLLLGLSVLVGVLLVTAFLCWAAARQSFPLTNQFQGTLALATPLILGALAGALGERAGVINVAIEGQFLVGAFASAVVATLAGSALVGLVAGAVGGVFVALLLAVFAIRYLVDQVVLGVVLDVFALGLTGFLLDSYASADPTARNSPPILEPIAVPGLSRIPVLGSVLFNQTLLVYLMYASVALVTWVLFETRWGLRVRSVGEHPLAADTVGIKVNRVRYQAVLVGGIFAGLGGAYYTVGSTGSFDKGLTAGNGFIALAALIMGRWHPIGATIAALFFGFASQLQSQLQILQTPIPSELLLMAPYLATIVAVAGLVGRVRPPAADGQPYVKG
jgi:ABC-type uncharacterized transport system permease subunit